MLDYLIAVSLILLLVGHTLLIRGCTQISLNLNALHDEGEGIHSTTGRISELLDELIQVAVDAMPEPNQPGPLAQPAGGLMEMVASHLLSKMSMPQTNEGDSSGYEKEQIREIYSHEATTQEQTEV
ncbi:hypothetical protein N9M68_00710 [Candidatus Poseidonia alphae]|nr:hypothetical protein [Candidatus Poseidonia alphae]